MTQTTINALLLTNAITLGALGYLVYENIQANSLKTTNQERAIHGSQCVDWLNERAKKEGFENGGYQLARSWRKHGQMVFEIVPDLEVPQFYGVNTLCVVDTQSGMRFRYTGLAMEPWLFYD